MLVYRAEISSFRIPQNLKDDAFSALVSYLELDSNKLRKMTKRLL